VGGASIGGDGVVGHRLRPDGERISITAEVPIGFDPSWVPVGELIADYWKAVGIRLEIKSETPALFFERTGANQHDASVYGGEYGLELAIVEPKWYLPLAGASLFGIEWAAWSWCAGRGADGWLGGAGLGVPCGHQGSQPAGGQRGERKVVMLHEG